MGKDDKNGAEAQAQQQQASRGAQPHVLGFSMDELGGLSVDELAGNKVALTMLLHYYKQLNDENTGLKNERNTLSTYVSSFGQKKSDARNGAIFMAASTIFTGFGVNMLTSDAKTFAGYGVFIPGLVLLVVGLYLSLRDGEK
ncbi:hypothetical protein [Herbaspirillum sp. NPDC101396]|uniref:hypothetical protein n=1 Tax=Herbaspirillum sp. NPDC101396 TaxID=3364005 RepID=UPI00383A72C8